MSTNLETPKVPNWKEQLEKEKESLQNELYAKQVEINSKVNNEVVNAFEKFRREGGDFAKEGNPILKTMGEGVVYRLDSYGEECELDVSRGKLFFIKTGETVDLDLGHGPNSSNIYKDYVKRPDVQMYPGEKNSITYGQFYRDILNYYIKHANFVNMAVSISRRHPGKPFYFEKGSLKIDGETVMSKHDLGKYASISPYYDNRVRTDEQSEEIMEDEVLGDLNKIVFG